MSRDGLKRFEGTYKLADGYEITVRSNDDYLMLEPAINRVKFFPYAERKFFAEGVEYRRIEFTSDSNENINGLLFRECVVELEAKKVK